MTFNDTGSKSQSRRNDQDINTKTTGNTLGFKFNNTYFSWMSIDFNMTKSWNKQNNGIIQNDLGKTESYTHNLNVFFYPLENHTIGFYWDQINSKLGQTKLNNGFLMFPTNSAGLRKKVDFELKWMNIADRKVFERINVGDATITQTTMQLRPSQVMFTVKFNFK